MMPKSSATYCRASRRDTRMLPGCMSAWKKPSRNTCVKKISTPARASAGMSMPLRLQRLDLRYRRAMHALHHHHAPRAVVPVHRGHREQRRVLEVAAQQRGIRRLAHQVELLLEVARELGHHFARLQAPAVGPEALHQPRRGLAAAARPARSPAPRPAAAPSPRLRRRPSAWRRAPARPRRSQRACCSNVSKSSCKGLPSELSISATASAEANGGTWSCSFASSSAISRGQQVAPRRQHLAELDEDRPQRLQRLAQARGVCVGSRAVREPRHEAVQPEAQPDVQDAQQAQQVAHLRLPAARCASPAAPGRRAGARAPPRCPASSPRATSSCFLFNGVLDEALGNAARRVRMPGGDLASPSPRDGAPPRRRRTSPHPPPHPSAGGGRGTSLRPPAWRCPRRRSRAAGGLRPSAQRRARRGRT